MNELKMYTLSKKRYGKDKLQRANIQDKMSIQQKATNVYSQYDDQVLCTRVSKDVNNEKVQSCLYLLDPMKYFVKALADYSQLDH